MLGISFFKGYNEDVSNKDALYGSEMIDQDLWNNVGLVYWNNTIGANWSGDGSKAISNGTNGNLVRNAFFVIGSIYKVEVSVTVVSGTFFGPCTTWGFQTSVSGNFTYFITASSVLVNVRSALFNGSLDAVSIRKLL